MGAGGYVLQNIENPVSGVLHRLKGKDMIVNYKGYEIDCRREESMGAGEHLYYGVFRISDGLLVIGSFTTGNDSERDFIGFMKERVDEFIKTEGASEGMEDYY